MRQIRIRSCKLRCMTVRDHIQPIKEPAWEIARLFPLQGEWSEDDYLNLPDNSRIELVNGRLVFIPMPTISHQIIIAFLYRLLSAYLIETQPEALVLFTSVPVRLAKDLMREPDILVVLKGLASQKEDKFVERPDMVIEVLSPSNRENDLIDKRVEYAVAKIPEYWIVDPLGKTMTVLTLRKGQYREHGVFAAGTNATSKLLPGFAVNVDDLWRSVAR